MIIFLSLYFLLKKYNMYGMIISVIVYFLGVILWKDYLQDGVKPLIKSYR